jgi:hypothetical protein
MNRTCSATIAWVLTVTGWAAPVDAGVPLQDTEPLDRPMPANSLATRGRSSIDRKAEAADE